MVHQLRIDNEGHVVTETGDVIGTYKVLETNEMGAVIQFDIKDQKTVTQMKGRVDREMSIGFWGGDMIARHEDLETALLLEANMGAYLDEFYRNPHIKPFH